MASPHHPNQRKPGDPEPRMPGWAADRLLDLRIKRWGAPPWVREEIDKQIERLKKLRSDEPQV